MPNIDAEPKAKVKSDAPKVEKTEAEKDVLIDKYKLKLAEFVEENKKFDAINAELINNLNTERRMVATLKSSLSDMGKQTAT